MSTNPSLPNVRLVIKAKYSKLLLVILFRYIVCSVLVTLYFYHPLLTATPLSLKIVNTIEMLNNVLICRRTRYTLEGGWCSDSESRLL